MSQSLLQQLHEGKEDIADNEAELADNIEEAEMVQWGPQQGGKLYDYLGPLSKDNIGFETVPSENQQDEQEMLHALHEGAEVIDLRAKKVVTTRIKVSHNNMYLQMGLSPGTGRPLYTVVEMRRGQKTRVFESHRLRQGPYSKHADMSLSVVFSERRVLNLVFNSVAECDLWWNGLSNLIEEAKHSDLVIFQLRSMFKEYHMEGLNRKLVKQLLSKLHFKTDERSMHRLFTNADANMDGVLVFSEFLSLILDLQKRPEIEEIFRMYAKGDRMTAEELSVFFHTEQMEVGWTIAKCQAMIDKQENGMDLPTFELMLNSPWNMLYRHYNHNEVYHDMTQPISCYFLSSSHNTYLEHGQIRGYAATDMYIRSLKLGAKCIELDTWDGPDGEPVIYHGHTMVSHIRFTDALEAIRDYAFIKSSYPLILSIENHCTIPQQIKMAQYFRDILGEMIADPFEYDDDSPHLPSPTDLMGKILLKGKMLEKSMFECEEDDVNKPGVKIAHELSSMIHLKLMPILSLNTISTTPPEPADMLNFSEMKCKKLAKTSVRDILRYNQNNMTRIYTRGTRLRSSNYPPNIAWAIGCQVVAYNFQRPGTARYVHEGMFADNGGCGYVLKPQPLRSESLAAYHPHHKQYVPGSKYSKLTVQVLSGRNLPAPPDMIVNPFVSVQVHGILADCRSFKTKKSYGNGLCPAWNETFEFPLCMSSLAVLVIKIATYNTNKVPTKLHYKHIGHFSTRVENLRAGYRVMPLVNQLGYQSGVGNLLCKITLEESSYNS